MKKSNAFSIRARIASIGYALRGLTHIIVHEHNMRIHLAATIAAITAGCIKGLDGKSWIALCIVIALVWITEAINTAIEVMCDLFGRNTYHSAIKIIKDVAAGAVLVAAILSLVVAGFIFLN